MVGCVSGSKAQFITSRLNHNTKILFFCFFYNSFVEVFIVYANIKERVKYINAQWYYINYIKYIKS